MEKHYSRSSLVPSREIRESTALLRTESTLRAIIEECRPGLGARVKIRFTSNTCTMVSKTERDGVVSLRVHHLFAHAPRDLLRRLVRFCFMRIRRTTSRAIRAELMDFVEEHREKTLTLYPRSRRLPPAGQTYNLLDVMHRVRRKHVGDLETTPEIGWTRQIHRNLMGKWIPSPSPHPNVVLVNRLLDHPAVPTFYVEFIVFHELLHELMPIGRACGRWVHHPPEFKRREKEFPRFDEAQKWEEQNLTRLYRNARRRARDAAG